MASDPGYLHALTGMKGRGWPTLGAMDAFAEEEEAALREVESTASVEGTGTGTGTEAKGQRTDADSSLAFSPSLVDLTADDVHPSSPSRHSLSLMGHCRSRRRRKRS